MPRFDAASEVMVPVGTALHDRTFPLCESLSYREWSGYYTVSSYEMHHEHEYNAIRNAAALIDISPLYKYLLTGRDATRLVDHIITRDMRKVSVEQVLYTPWCDGRGKVIDDGTVTRLAENTYRWTAADPSLRWFRQNAVGMDVTIEDISERTAALALQGPTTGRLLRAVAEADISALKYFRMTSGNIAGVPVDISRTGYTGDLGYEIWMPRDQATRVWDALMEAMIEAGLLLIDVDFNGCKKAIIESQTYSPYEMGLTRLVQLEKGRFIGQTALREEHRRGPAREIVGLELDWTELECLYEKIGLAPQIPATASRVAVPIYLEGRQVGKATSTTWSPTLKKLIALATVDAPHNKPGTQLRMEVTVEAVRGDVAANVIKLPFFNPKRKTAIPPWPPWPA